MTTTEHAAAIRTRLKTLGITSRDVSIRAEYFSLGSAINIIVKNPAVSVDSVQAIADPAEHIRRDERTGEILSGGNRYLSVRYSHEAEQTIRKPFMAAAEKTLAEVRAMSPDTFSLTPIGETGFLLGRCCGRPWAFGVWGPNQHEGEADNAERIADILVRER